MMSSFELLNCRRKMLMFKLFFLGFVVMVIVRVSFLLCRLWRFWSHEAEVLLHVIEVNDALLVFFKSFGNFCPDVVFTKDLINRQLVPGQSFHFVFRFRSYELRKFDFCLRFWRGRTKSR